MSSIWFDAHLDLAYLAVHGRDMTGPLDPAAGPHPPASVTLPALAEGNVRFILGTIFTERDGDGPEGYPAGNVERAHAAGRAQLEAYLTWRDRGLLSLDGFAAIRSDPGIGEVRAGMGVGSVVPIPIETRLRKLLVKAPLHCGILIENADPIRSPADLAWWKERGVVAIGLTWSKSSRYAGGNLTHDGLTDLGRAMVREMDRLGIIHDASHLSERAFDELFDLTDRTIIASHSNCRSIADPTGKNQRHITDEQVRRIVERGGVIGLNFVRNFIKPGLDRSNPLDRPSIDEALRHVDRVCEIAGHRRAVGLGSDMDGGIPAHDLPAGIDRPADLLRVLDALSGRGWSDADIGGFAHGNWLRIFAA